jgi:hypothetical protein
MRKSARATEESNKRSNSRKEKLRYHWANGTPAWTSVTDCKGILHGVETHNNERVWPPVADTETARHQFVSQQPTSHHHEINGEDRWQTSAPCIISNSKDDAQDEIFQVQKDGNGQYGGDKQSFMRSKEQSHSSSSQIQHIPIHSSSRGFVCQKTARNLQLE